MNFGTWNCRSISTRLICITMFPVAIMFGSVVWYSYHARVAAVQERLAEQGSVIATVLAKNFGREDFPGNLSELRHVMEGMIESNASVARIDILDASRREILHAASDLPPNVGSRIFEMPISRPVLHPAAPAGMNSRPASVPHLSEAEKSATETHNAAIIGHVRVTLSSAQVLAKETYRFNVLLSMALLMLAPCLLFAYLLSRSLIKPLTTSIAALGSIRAGDYTVHVDVTAGGEIGDLQSSINALSVSLNHFRQDLEQKVVARTRALEDSRNEALKANEEKRKLIQKVDSAVEDERKTIAIEIHDELNATLIAARLDLLRILNLATNAPASATNEEIKLKAESLISLMLKLYSSARNLVRRLRPEVLELLGLRGAVEEIVRNYNDSQQTCRFEFQSTGDFSNLDNTLAIAAFRLIQEALSNVVKHSGASQASVSLLMSDANGALQITVTDNGRGFDPSTAVSGIGIIGMRERVYAFNGSVEIQSSASGGTCITIGLPLGDRTINA